MARHFMAYHNAEKMGFSQIELRKVFTNKPVDQSMVGDHVWLIVGKGRTDKDFFLGCRFTIDHAGPTTEPGFKNEVSGHDGRIFKLIEPINNLPWFEDLQKENHRFSFGLVEIKNRELIWALEQYAQA